jgi:hypothetical protein
MKMTSQKSKATLFAYGTEYSQVTKRRIDQFNAHERGYTNELRQE